MARWVQIWLCFLLTAVGYIDRSNLSVAAPFIRADLHISDAAMGLILGSFYCSYAGLQVPCGWLVDRVSLRGGVAVAVIVWSLATIGTAMAMGAASLFAFRLLLGVGEGPIYPAAGKLISMRFLPPERGRASGILQCGSRAGAVAAVPLVSAIIAAYGWRPAFLITGLLGFLLAGAWIWLYRDAPTVPTAAQAGASQPLSVAAMLTVLRHRNFAGIAGGGFLMLFANYFFFTWFPTYLVRARGFSLVELGTLGALPMLVGLPAPYLGGLLSDRLISQGWTVSRARKDCMTAGMLLGSSLMLIPFVHDTAAMIAVFCVANAGLAGTCGILFALPAEISPGPALVGTVGAMMNCICNLAGIATSAFIGAVLTLTGGSFSAPLIALGAASLLAAAWFHWITGEIASIPIIARAQP